MDAGSCRGPARAGRGRQRHQPPHPRETAHQLGHAADGRGQRAGGAGGAAAAPRDAARPFRLVLLDAHMPEHGRLRPGRADHSSMPSWAAATIMMLTSAGSGATSPAAGAGHRRLPDQADHAGELWSRPSARLCGSRQGTPDARPVITQHTLREAGQRLRILLAEDNPSTRSWPSACWRSTGIRVVVVGDGQDALTRAGAARAST